MKIKKKLLQKIEKNFNDPTGIELATQPHEQNNDALTTMSTILTLKMTLLTVVICSEALDEQSLHAA